MHSKLYLLLILTILQWFCCPSSFASSECEKIVKAHHPAPTGPKGKLHFVKEESSSRTGGTWHKDEAGELWFLKADPIHKELQTAAEVISSDILRLFGYKTADTHIVYIDNERYAAIKFLGSGTKSTLINDAPNTTEFRQLRLLSAFIEDWDRLRVGPNNLILSNGEIAYLDFAGSLGARPMGEHKPGFNFSEAIGPFGQKVHFAEVLNDYKVNWLPLNHPWRNLTSDDAKEFQRKLRELLTDSQIERIVKGAQYSQMNDELYMIEALKKRRDSFTGNALRFFDQIPSLPVGTLIINGRPVDIQFYLLHFEHYLYASVRESVFESTTFVFNDYFSPQEISILEAILRHLKGTEYVVGLYTAKFYKVNRQLRNEGSDLSDPIWKIYYRNLLEELQEMPAHLGIVYRGVNYANHPAVLALYLKLGNIISESSFISTTVVAAKAEHYISAACLKGDNDSFPTRCLLVIETKTGRSLIGRKIHYHDDKEVLLLPNTRLRVIEVKKKVLGRYKVNEIHLEEID